MICSLPEPQALQPDSLGRVHQRIASCLPGEPCSESFVMWTLLSTTDVQQRREALFRQLLSLLAVPTARLNPFS